jgi:hypothetical protein
MKALSTVAILTKAGAQLSAKSPLTKAKLEDFIIEAFKLDGGLLRIQSADDNDAIMYVPADQIQMVSIATIIEKPVLTMAQGGLVAPDGSKLQ